LKAQIETISPVTTPSDRPARKKSKYVGLRSQVATASSLQQSRFPKRCQKILLHVGKALSRYGWPRYQHQFDWLGQFMLMQPKSLPQEAPRTASGNRPANPGRSYHPESRGPFSGKLFPVGNQDAVGQALAIPAHAREVSTPLNATLAAKA
jgi:hypothetical protein